MLTRSRLVEIARELGVAAPAAGHFHLVNLVYCDADAQRLLLEALWEPDLGAQADPAGHDLGAIDRINADHVRLDETIDAAPCCKSA